MRGNLVVAGLVLTAALTWADWPTLRGNPQRTGYVDVELPHALDLAWAAEFDGERLGTAMEPIVAGGLVLVATHRGNVWALNARTGGPQWRFEAGAPILHSPSVSEGRVVAATSDGALFALRAADGTLAWRTEVDPDGVAASPLATQGRVYLGTRGGFFGAYDLHTGARIWQRPIFPPINPPIRQSPALDGDRIWITSEALSFHCFDAATGTGIWMAEPVPGQSARDYYPVVTHRGRREFVVFRTNPTLNMARRIARDRTVLARNAGFDDRDWRRIDAWTTSKDAAGSPESWRQEGDAIRAALNAEPDSRSFFVFNASAGSVPLPSPPVFWLAGCQGVPAPPVVLPDGRLFTLYRSAYGHWTHGVAPLVGVGILDPVSKEMEPLFHQQGSKPPWNTFWGTADESQNVVVFRKTAIFVHQGTLSRFDWEAGRLTPILGERDTFGGFPASSWARNEWHGPGRGGVAWDEGRLFWLTGSRVLCLVPNGRRSPLRTLRAPDMVPAGRLPPRPAPGVEQLQSELWRTAEELVSELWAPLLVEPGLAGTAAFFDTGADHFQPLALAWPRLPQSLRARIRTWLSEQPDLSPLPSSPRRLPNVGMARIRHSPPDAEWAGIHSESPRLAFGNVSAYLAWLQAIEPAESPSAGWPEILAAWRAFRTADWHLDPNQGDPHANRYLASLRAFSVLAQTNDDPLLAAAADSLVRETEDALVAWWERTARELRQTSFAGVRELDAFIGRGAGLFFAVAPHRHRLALFQDLDPEIGAMLRERCPDAVDAVWDGFERLCPTWWLVGEERQVHTGENFLDTPDFAMSAFRAFAYLKRASAEDLARRVDLPFGRADLFHLSKLAMALQATRPPIPDPATAGPGESPTQPR